MMKCVSITLPDIFINGLERLRIAGVIPTRAEGLRIAVMEHLKNLDHDYPLLEGNIPEVVK